MDSYNNLSKLGVDLNEPLTTQTLVTAISSLYDLFLQEKQHREELQEQIFEQKERWKKIVQPQIESLLDSVDDLVEQLETFNDDILSLNQKNASLTEFVNIEKTTVHDDIAVLQDKIDEIQSKLSKQQQQQLSQTQTQHQGPFTAPGGTPASGTSTSGVASPLPRQTGGLTSSSKQMLSRLVSNISGQRLQPTVVNKRDNPHDMLRPMDRPGRKLYTRSQLYSYRPSPVDTAKYITFTSFQSDFEQSKDLHNDNDNADNNNNSIKTDSENNPENCEKNNCKIETKKDMGNDDNNNNNPEQSKEFAIYLPRELSVGDESQHNVETLSSNHAKQIGIVSNKNPYSTDHNRDTANNNYHQNTTSSQKWGKYSQDERQMIQNQYNNQHNRSTTSHSAYHILQNGGNNTMNNNQNNTKKNSSSCIETDMWRRVEPLPEEIEHHKNPLFQTFYSPTQNPEESVDDDNSSSSKLTKQTLWLNDNLSQMQILLNKLTPQKVETFSTKIISIISFHDETKGAYSDELQLSCFVHLIVNRSLKEAQLVPTYAKLSQLIATSPELKEFTFQTCSGENALYSPQLASKSIPLRFRVCLVLYCQYLLVQYINYKKSKFISNQEGQDEHQNDDNAGKVSQDSKELNKAVYEQQSITDSRKGRNFCHFIAELYLQGLLGLGPCMEAVSCLLQSHDEDDIVVVLDFFTGLIKSTSPNTSKFPLKTYMDKLEEIKNTKQLVFIAEDKTQHCQPLQNRTRFLIMDVLDLWDKKCKNTNK